jgi:F-type H+-transporting ATPase subunit delta
MDDATAQTAHVERYASALLNVAGAEIDPSAAADEIFRAAQGLSGHTELIETLADPRIPAEIKQGIVDDLLDSRASKVTVAAMNFVIGVGLAKQLSAIASRLVELAADAEGEVVAEVRSAIELNPVQIERLRAAINSVTGKRVQVKTVIDPSVIGGLVAKVGDTVLDGSVQHRFSELREQWG